MQTSTLNTRKYDKRGFCIWQHIICQTPTYVFCTTPVTVHTRLTKFSSLNYNFTLFFRTCILTGGAHKEISTRIKSVANLFMLSLALHVWGCVPKSHYLHQFVLEHLSRKINSFISLLLLTLHQEKWPMRHDQYYGIEICVIIYQVDLLCLQICYAILDQWRS